MLIEKKAPGAIGCRDPQLKFAAAEFAKYLSKCFGARFAVSEKTDDDKTNLTLGLFDDPEISARLAEKRIDVSEYLNADSETYAIVTTPDGVLLCGNRPRSVLYAVYDILENDIGGCFAISADGIEHTPSLTKIELRTSRRMETAAFPVRGLGFHTDDNIDADLYFNMIDWLAKLKYNRIQLNLRLWGELSERLGPMIEERDLDLDLGVHSLGFFLPPDEYFEKHPEWYAEVDSRFGRQLRFANLESVPTAVSNIIDCLKKTPNVKYFGLWPLDGTAFDPQEIDSGKMGDIVLTYVNAVAEEITKVFPDMIFDHLAYVGYVAPPTETIPISKVMTSVCHYWDRMFTRPIYDFWFGRANNAAESSKVRTAKNFSPMRSHRQCCDDLKGWIELGDTIVFTYYPDLNLSNHNVFDVWDVIQQDMRYYHALEVKGTLACYCMHKEYLWIYREIHAMGVFQWNPNANAARINKKLLNAVFGNAEVADEIEKFYDSLDTLHNKPLFAGFSPSDLLRGIGPTYELSGYDVKLHKVVLEQFDERWNRSARFLDRAFERSAASESAWSMIEELMFNLVMQKAFMHLGCRVLCAIGHRELASKGKMNDAEADSNAVRLCGEALGILNEFTREHAERISLSKGLQRKVKSYESALEKDFPTMEAPL